MGILGLAGILLVLGLIFGPQFWVKHAISKHSVARPDLAGTGGELAEHLIDHFQIGKTGVEITEKGDHYDPRDHMVRLLKNNYDGQSISAVAIAAHEVGHAIQHHQGTQ